MATPRDAAPEIAAWHGLVRVQGAVRRDLDEALRAAEGVSLWDYAVLRTLSGARDRCMRMTELARATDYTPSGLTRLVERLERAGLVRRDPCPEDRRGAVATLTLEGQRAFVRARRTHVAEVRKRFLDRCSEEELATLVELWERLLPGSTV
ncbi:MAG TPA: MarR family transcriptional regulator [Miltoncostaeaceae bacterium]|jgi:DNA-binding MarR family transcriptional regulator|nr:MarR family transcriptional regulator [Miltoncostaeaceae bacterium]